MSEKELLLLVLSGLVVLMFIMGIVLASAS